MVTMRHLVRAMLVLLALGGMLVMQARNSHAQDPSSGQIRATVEGQLAAFARDDGGTAFGFAAPGIRQLFGTAESFMAMVRRGYQPVYRPKSVQFLDIVVVDGRPIQRVLLVGPDGEPVMALYTMEQQADGRWLIAGCQLVDAGESI